jgi:hypothetical protein
MFMDDYNQVDARTDALAHHVSSQVFIPVDMPAAEHRLEYEKRCNALEVPKVGVPWFAKIIALNRSEFKCTAIVKSWDSTVVAYPPIIFVIALAIQSPISVTFVTAKLLEPTGNEISAAGARPSICNYLPTYDVSDFQCSSANDIGICDDDDIMVFPALAYHDSGVVVGAHAIPFLEFAVGMRDSESRSTNGAKTRRLTVPKESYRDLLDKYPWLTEYDIRMAYEKVAKPKGADTVAHYAPMHLNPEDMDELVIAELLEALAEKRAKWAFEDDDVVLNFYTWINGGAWTKKFIGKVADSVTAKGRAHTAAFCKLCKWPQTKTFTFTEYGEFESHQLAREWCRRRNWFFEKWLASGGTERFITPESREYVSSDLFQDFVANLDEGSNVKARADELANCFPDFPHM